MSNKQTWTEVPDEAVRHIWKDEETGEEIEISPDWYQNNGTPITEYGDDMVYVRTEIFASDI
jgi:hypothetical protein